jgi:hypothetical protein
MCIMKMSLTALPIGAGVAPIFIDGRRLGPFLLTNHSKPNQSEATV